MCVCVCVCVCAFDLLHLMNHNWCDTLLAVLENGCSLVQIKETQSLRSPGFPQNYTYTEGHCLENLLYTAGQSMFMVLLTFFR